MAKLFKRKITLTVDTTQITDLNIEFDVVRTLKAKPNTLEATIYNLKEETRKKIERLKRGVRVRLEAGYESGTSQIFLGDLRAAYSQRDSSKPDIKTIITAGDGEKSQISARFNKSYRKGTNVRTVLKEIVESLGLEIGNADSALQTTDLGGVASTFENGVVISGNASDELTRLLRANGLEWSVQDGKVQILGIRNALTATAIKLTPETGLIGSPSIDNKRILKARTLIIPDLFPGRKIIIDAFGVTGTYRVQRTQHRGSLYGKDFYCDLEGKAI